MNRIGLFGGTFNPIHFGHLRSALEVQEGFGLDRIYLIPSAFPPHKETVGIADVKDRLEMIRLAAAAHPGFFVSDVELQRQHLSYTVDTVVHFKSSCPKDCRLYLIMGLDAFQEIDTWKSYLDLFDLIPIIVMTRPQSQPDPEHSGQERLDLFLQSRISSQYQYSAAQSAYIHPAWQPVHLFAVTSFAISSTRIRQSVKKGRSIKFLVPENVARFITARGLYL
ncbi:MAG: nicotinate-nucleotide adenylyltransferase [Desulfobacterales bacterium]|nr:nicotinate-nucleotide adenylyltransferase [Desulfobacterales bacterium]